MATQPSGILQLTGPPQSGKTTLCNLLIEELAPRSTLVIDASANYGMTRLLCGLKPEQPVPKTVWDALSPLQDRASIPSQTVDWLFHSLPQPVGEQIELLTLGPMPDEMSAMLHFPVLKHPMLQALMGYGLPRLLPQYEVVLVDGFHPDVHRLLPDSALCSLLLLSPQQAEGFTSPAVLKAFADWVQALSNPSLVLNKLAQGQGWKSLPDVLQHYFNRHGIRLLGKLPQVMGATVATDSLIHETLSPMIREILCRLALPLL
jgi:hypothetical protein